MHFHDENSSPPPEDTPFSEEPTPTRRSPAPPRVSHPTMNNGAQAAEEEAEGGQDAGAMRRIRVSMQRPLRPHCLKRSTGQQRHSGLGW